MTKCDSYYKSVIHVTVTYNHVTYKNIEDFKTIILYSILIV